MLKYNQNPRDCRGIEKTPIQSLQQGLWDDTTDCTSQMTDPVEQQALHGLVSIQDDVTGYITHNTVLLLNKVTNYFVLNLLALRIPHRAALLH